MTTSSLNILFISIYMILWIATLVWYQYRQRKVDAGSIVIILYIVYTVFSILNVNDPVFSDEYTPMRLFPFIYLYLMMMIAHSPAIHHHLHPTNRIENPHTRILKVASYVIIFCSLVILPGIILNFKSGVLNLFSDADAGQAAYLEGLSNAEDSGSGITNIPAIIYNAMNDLCFFLFFYFLTIKEKSKIFISLLGLSMSVGILMPIMQGQRGNVINGMLTLLMSYFLFKQYLSKTINRVVKILGIAAIIIVTFPIVSITMSRFGSSNAGVTSFINWYVGQGNLYFNSYGLDDNGIRYGDRTFNLFKRVIDPSTSKNFRDRRERYHQLHVNDNKFTTFVGDFTIDFGPVVAPFIFIIFNLWVLLRIRSHDETIKLHQLLLVYFTLCVSTQGGMTLYSFSDSANLRIITIFSLYGYLYYHELLLKRFPLKEKQEELLPTDNE
ncbi:MAG: oligosaccharide repeat unit polymerase [Prevotella sp.]|nr:oligosaccharide repeat unit polymerase [Prevotella sp.]